MSNTKFIFHFIKSVNKFMNSIMIIYGECIRLIMLLHVLHKLLLAQNHCEQGTLLIP